ncbi:MAG: ABC transporter ATP-binding protein [Hydrogenoanaerobacterium sp.]
MQTIIKLEDLQYTYSDGTQALRGVTLSINKGEKVAVLGANGSGKSTLFLCLNGVYKPCGGAMLFDEKAVSYDKKGLIDMRKNVGVVFQDPETQLFCVDVYQEVAFGPHNLGYSKEQIHECVTKALDVMDLNELSAKPPHFLSGGQKKRVTVAAVLAMSPRVILFDEPASSLDPLHSALLMDEINGLSAQGITVLMATHDVNMAYSWADKIVVLDNGRVKAQGTPDEIFANGKLLSEAGLCSPFVLSTYNALTQAGILQKNAVPHSMAELLRLIATINGEKV